MQLVLIAHNIRSTHNVGSLLRTADGLGVRKVFLTGYTPYPGQENDTRLPHLAAKLHKQISKTSLGAEESVVWKHAEQIEPVIDRLRSDGYEIAALEQAPGSANLVGFKWPARLALIVGREVEGIEQDVLRLTDHIIEIPMHGKKESLNVAVAAAIAMFSLKNQA